MLTFYTNLWRGKYDILFGLDFANFYHVIWCVMDLDILPSYKKFGKRLYWFIEVELTKHFSLLVDDMTNTYFHPYLYSLNDNIPIQFFCATFIPITTHKIFQDSYILKNIKMLYRRKHNIQWSRLRNTFDIIFLTWQIC